MKKKCRECTEERPPLFGSKLSIIRAIELKNQAVDFDLIAFEEVEVSREKKRREDWNEYNIYINVSEKWDRDAKRD